MSEWKPILMFDLGDALYEGQTQCDLWFDVQPCARTFGISDSFRVTDCWRKEGKWWHQHNGKTKQLADEWITHWMPLPEPPQ